MEWIGWLGIGLLTSMVLILVTGIITGKIMGSRGLKRIKRYAEADVLTDARQREMNITAVHHHPGPMSQKAERLAYGDYSFRPIVKRVIESRAGYPELNTPGDEILKVDPKTWLREEDKRARREWDLEWLELTSGIADSRTLRIGVMQRLLREEGIYNGPCDGKQTSEFTISLRRWTEQMWHAKTRTLANGAMFAPDTLHPHDLRGKVTGVSGQVVTFARGIVD